MIRGDDAMAPAPVEEEASPDVAEVEQRDLPPDVPTVKVEVCNTAPVRVVVAPALRGTVALETAPGDRYARILTADPKRASATVVAETKFHIAHKRLGNVAYGTWPANVPLPWGSADELYAKSTTADAVSLTVITEVYAD